MTAGTVKATIKKRIEKFREVVEVNKEARFNIIVTQMDPDAIASALGLYFIFLLKECKASIWYCGSVSHPQNRAVMNRYNLIKLMKPISEFQESESDVFVLVDSSSVADSRLPDILQGKINPVIVIDHHRGELEEKDENFIWIEEVGSASTLVIELIRGLDISLAEEDAEVLFPLLTLGIYSDTKMLVGAGKRDVEAYHYVSNNISPQEFRTLVRYPLPDSHFEYLKRALDNTIQQGSRLLTYVGVISAKHGDDLSTIADYLIRMDGVSSVFVWGIVEDEVRLSARNVDISTPFDEFLKERFGDSSGAKLTPDGQGEGGALINLDLGFWSGEDTADEVIALVSKKMRALVFSD